MVDRAFPRAMVLIGRPGAHGEDLGRIGAYLDACERSWAGLYRDAPVRRRELERQAFINETFAGTLSAA